MYLIHVALLQHLPLQSAYEGTFVKMYTFQKFTMLFYFQQMKVYAPPDFQIGTVLLTNHPCRFRFAIKNSLGKKIYYVKGPCLCALNYGISTFRVKSFGYFLEKNHNFLCIFLDNKCRNKNGNRENWKIRKRESR